ncbi:MAG: hypothetical protein U0Z75_03210 [Deinococcaceae bacterium]
MQLWKWIGAGLILSGWNSVEAQQGPRIEAIRTVYNEVGRLKNSGQLHLTKKEIRNCTGSTETHQIWTDTQGKIRQYTTKDGVYTFEYTFDAQGVLRYLGGAGNSGQGQRIVWRFYFNDRGTQIWYDYQYEGGRYNWTDPKKRVALNPTALLGMTNAHC